MEVRREIGEMDVQEYLERPYGRLVVRDVEGGGFTAEILEFPNCIAEGGTAAEALSNLEEVAVDWIDAELEQGHSIPEPMESAGYSGKLVLRMPKGLHKRATLCAELDATSLNQFIVACLAECVGERSRVPTVVYPVSHFEIIGTVKVQVAGTNAANFTGTLQGSSGAIERVTAANSGPAILPITQWYKPERRHA